MATVIAPAQRYAVCFQWAKPISGQYNSMTSGLHISTRAAPVFMAESGAPATFPPDTETERENRHLMSRDRALRPQTGTSHNSDNCN